MVKWRSMTCCVFGGMVLTVVISWAAAAWAEVQQFAGETVRAAKAGDRPEYLASFWPPPIRVREVHRRGVGVSETSVLCTEIAASEFREDLYEYNKGPLRASVDRFSFGWPLRAMYWEDFGYQGDAVSKQAVFEFLDRSAQAAGYRGRHAFPSWVPGVSGSFRSVPLAVLPIGFLVDATMFSAMLAALVLAPGAIRRGRRRRRGLCVGCGYDLAGAAPCPECGRESSPRA